MKIVLSGGGTLGPVTPLLALAERWRADHRDVEVLWVGTVNGPEAALVRAHEMRFISMASVKVPSTRRSIGWLFRFWPSMRLLRRGLS